MIRSRTHYVYGRRRHQKPSRQSLFGLTLLGVAAWLTMSSISTANNGRLVQLYVDDSSRTVLTSSTTVAEVLEEADVMVGQLDLVEPALTTTISGDDFHINVYRSRPILIVDGTRRYTISTPYSSPQLIARSAGLATHPEDIFHLELVREFVDEGFIGQKLTIERAIPVQIELDGQTFTFRTHASTIQGLLDEKGITLGADDFTSLPLDTSLSADLHFAVIRVGHEVVTEEHSLPFETRIIIDHDLAYGEKRIEQEGQAGSEVSSFEITRHNGREVSRQLISTARVSEPVALIVVKGTRIREPYTNNEQILAALRECETHGNYQANTGNGYYGAYQFLDSTWDRWATGYSRADLAPPEVQDATTLQNARASLGGFWSQHPGCSDYLHLPKFPF